MLLKAINQICVGPNETYMPGDIFTIRSETEQKRLISLGAAIPAKKKISIEVDMSERDTGGKNEV